MRFPRYPLTAASLCVAVAVWACGPSVQLIYEGNIRFEHCYRLDFDAQIAPTHRKVCWVEWVENYSKGQTRDRIEYGKRRIDALNGGDGKPLLLQLESDSDAGAPLVLAGPAPVPTSVHAPPPPVIPAAIVVPVNGSAAGSAGDSAAGGAAGASAEGGRPGRGKAKGQRATGPGSSRADKTKP